jgi:3',5'-cyclic AMP phosphodiesterase CpdA
MLKLAATGAAAFVTLAGLAAYGTGPSRAAPRARAEAEPKASAAASLTQTKAAAVLPAFRFAVISDLNQGYGSTHYGSDVVAAIGALAARFRPGLVLITGDMVAGQKNGVNAPAMWRAFHSTVTEPLARAGIAVAPTPGNHDASPSFMAERSEYVRQWSAHQAGLKLIDDSYYPLRYSFAFQGAFFLSLDAASVGPLSNEQRDWVERQLVQAKDYAVKIAFGHLPLYPIAHGREREIVNDAKLEALFERYGVELYASGHQHAYYPGATLGMRHLSMPCLGDGSRSLLGTRRPSARALALVQVESGDIRSIDAYSAPDFTKSIARSALPAQLALGNRVLWRDDVVPTSVALAAPSQ